MEEGNAGESEVRNRCSLSSIQYERQFKAQCRSKIVALVSEEDNSGTNIYIN